MQPGTFIASDVKHQDRSSIHDTSGILYQQIKDMQPGTEHSVVSYIIDAIELARGYRNLNGKFCSKKMSFIAYLPSIVSIILRYATQ